MKTSRTTFPIYEQDRQAIRVIREHYGARSDAEAIRIALREMARAIQQIPLPKPQTRNDCSSPA